MKMNGWLTCSKATGLRSTVVDMTTPVAYLVANGYLARPVFRSIDFESQDDQIVDPDVAD